MQIKKASPNQRVTSIERALTLLVFVVLPAAALWWLKGSIPNYIWWPLVLLFVAWLARLIGLQPDSEKETAQDLDIHDRPPTERPTWQQTVERIEASRTAPANNEDLVQCHPSMAMESDTRAAILKAASIAKIDAEPLLRELQQVVKAHESGSPRELELLMRTCCPKDCWDWPEAQALLQAQGSRGTRIQQVQLVASLISRSVMWGARKRQLYEPSSQRRRWQFRACDGRSPADCIAIDGRIAWSDDHFWSTHAPWHCMRAQCLCTVRAISDSEDIENIRRDQSTPQQAAPPQPQATSAQPWQTVIARAHEGIERCIASGDWDSARMALQRVAFGMVNASANDKAAFTSYMRSFAARDPLYQAIMKVATPLILQTPGLRQTQLYPHFVGVDAETIRYVLYYAEQLGEIERRKKGNSYTLWPRAVTIDVQPGPSP